MKYFECGICGCFHLWEFQGDCRDDSQRFTSDSIKDDDEVLTWDDRIDADRDGEV